MNNPKLTNILLIALIAINVLFLLGWHIHAHHCHHQQVGYGRFHGGEHGRPWAFHRGFRNHYRHINCCNYNNQMSQDN